MQIKIFCLPVGAPFSAEEEVNKFLRSHRVMTVDRHFSAENGGYWSLLITYQENGSLLFSKHANLGDNTHGLTLVFFVKSFMKADAHDNT